MTCYGLDGVVLEHTVTQFHICDLPQGVVVVALLPVFHDDHFADELVVGRRSADVDFHFGCRRWGADGGNSLCSVKCRREVANLILALGVSPRR